MKYLAMILGLSLSSPAAEEAPSPMAELLQQAGPGKTFVQTARTLVAAK